MRSLYRKVPLYHPYASRIKITKGSWKRGWEKSPNAERHSKETYCLDSSTRETDKTKQNKNNPSENLNHKPDKINASFPCEFTRPGLTKQITSNKSQEFNLKWFGLATPPADWPKHIQSPLEEVDRPTPVVKRSEL